MSHFRNELSEFPVIRYVSRHSPSIKLGTPHATLTVRIRDGSASDRSNSMGGGSSGPEGGIERKWTDGEVVARHRREWVGETARDHSGGEGMGWID
jgi:hypothetical protein